jgi:hypothetical protein
MQRTADRSAFPLSMTFTFNLQRADLKPGDLLQPGKEPIDD